MDKDPIEWVLPILAMTVPLLMLILLISVCFEHYETMAKVQAGLHQEYKDGHTVWVK